MDSQGQREWMEQWRAAGPALARQRERELRALSDERALAAAEALLSLVGLVSLPQDRRLSSGLVAQQALFHRRRLHAA